MRTSALLPLLAAALAGCATPSASEPVATDLVVVPGAWVFEPVAIVVPAGTTVTWRNDGGQAHSVTFEDGADLDVAPGGSVTRSFGDAGTFAYACKYHPPDMAGRVLVAEGEA